MGRDGKSAILIHVLEHSRLNPTWVTLNFYFIQNIHPDEQHFYLPSVSNYQILGVSKNLVFKEKID